MKQLFLIIAVTLLSGSAFAQLATPTFALASSGSFSATNAVYDPILSPSGATTCWSTNGTTPTAAVAGTCDAGFYTSGNQSGCYFAASGTCKAIATKAGSTNSAVATATYTITKSAPTNPVSVITPFKVTSATTNIIDEEPLAVNVAGTIYLFYAEGISGVTIDDGGAARDMMNTSTDGIHWSSPPSSGFCNSGDPSTGCLFNTTAALNYANQLSGLGVSTAGTLMVFLTSYTTPAFNDEGMYECRLPSGGSWNCFVVATPSNPSPNQFQNPSTNLISIAAGESGVTGPCFTTGCSFIGLRNGASSILGNIFSYDDGLTWSDPVNFSGSSASLTFPYITEEHATIRLPNTMDVMLLSRPSETAQSTGGPTPITFQSSSTLGSTWNGSYLVNGVTYWGNAANLPLTPCNVSPTTQWQDEWTAPSVAQDPSNPALYTLLYGERYQCPSPSNINLTQWQIVTFNGGTVYSGNGLNLPSAQVLQFNNIANNPCTTGNLTVNPHTAYSHIVVLNSTQLEMFYECGTVSPAISDIYGAIISYPTGQTVNGNIAVSGGVRIQ